MIYAFDEADPELTLMPMAARRALDAAGIKLSLASYQTLGLSDRRALLQLGAAEPVDPAAVRAVAARASGPAVTEVPVVCEPAELPAGLAELLALDAQRWRRFSALDRYVLDKLFRRRKLERLRRAYAEIAGRGGAP